MKHSEIEILEALKTTVKLGDLVDILPNISEKDLSDFFKRVSTRFAQKETRHDSPKSRSNKQDNDQLTATLFIDGASDSNDNGGIGVVFQPSDGEDFIISRSIGKATNNEAEYISLITAITEALNNNFKHIAVYSDSELLVKQVNGSYKVRAHNLKVLHDTVIKFKKKLEGFSISWVPRDENELADELAKKGSRLRAVDFSTG